MVRICHLITSLDVGGAEMSLFRLLSAMDRYQFHSSVISLIEPGTVGELIRGLGIQVRSLGLKRGSVAPAGLIRLTRWLRQNRPRILMTWLYHADLLGLTAARMARVPAVVWNLRAANMDMSQYRRLSGRTLRLCATLSAFPDAVVVNSQSGRAFHSQIGYHPREWVFIPNGVDPMQFRPDAAARQEVKRELGVPPGSLLVGLAARFDPMKDHATFVEAARRLSLKEKTAHFALAGAGIGNENPTLGAALAHPPLAGRMHLLGERHDMPRLTAAFDIACSSSCSEAFPNAVAEAMACGAVCVATDAGDSADILGGTGIVVPTRNPEALSVALLRAISMRPEERVTSGRAARERVIQQYTLARCAREYESLFARMGRMP